ncbi:MAG: hypothetical protein JXR71_01425 [Bacteroidales bacterium]|nr:hypothetical protein [Bacteroidales bacterium]
MDTINNTVSTAFPTDSFLFTVLFLLALFFLQKYIYLADRKIAQFTKKDGTELRKPWSFLVALLLGAFVFFYNVFSPDDLTFNIAEWHIEWVVFAVGLFTLTGIIRESFKDFGPKAGLIRSVLYVLLTVLYFYAGLISGYLIVSLLALAVLFYFLRYWKKLLIPK